MIKIIEGKYKRKIIYTPDTVKTKPTASRLRKSIFDVLAHSKYMKNNIFKTRVLDVYAGSGAMGIECLSRGATHCNFIDNSYDSIKMINKNLNDIVEKKNTLVTNIDATNPPKAITQYGMAFFAPPYRELNFSVIFKKWEEKGWFAENFICIYEKRKKTNFIPIPKFKIIHNIVKSNSEVIILFRAE